MRRTSRYLFATLLLTAPPASARDTLGVFENWGAFRDSAPPRCYAIAEPARPRQGATWQPFASVANWPAAGVRGQLHIRLRERAKAGALVTLSIDDRHFALVAGGADAWAPGPHADTAIVAAMRSASSMSVETADEKDKPLVDVYRLRGAATAIDAAALACGRMR
jgi:hypothetical protein